MPSQELDTNGYDGVDAREKIAYDCQSLQISISTRSSHITSLTLALLSTLSFSSPDGVSPTSPLAPPTRARPLQSN